MTTLALTAAVASAQIDLGGVVGWGDFSQGQSTSSSSPIRQVATGGFFQAYLRTDGSVVAWGIHNHVIYDDLGQTYVPAQLTGVVQIGACDFSSIALRSLTIKTDFPWLKRGVKTTGTLSIFLPVAPTSDVKISLSTTTAELGVPGSVTVPAGHHSATATITAYPQLHPSGTYLLTATYNGATTTASIKVADRASLLAILAPTSIGQNQKVHSTIALDLPALASSPMVLALTSNDPSLDVPSAVRVPSGASCADVMLSTLPVTKDKLVTFTASVNGTSKTFSIWVRATPAAGKMVLYPTTVPFGKNSSATVTLTAPAPIGGAKVVLSSDDPAAKVPATITIPAGQTSARVTIPTSLVYYDVLANITATYNGTTVSAPLGITYH